MLPMPRNILPVFLVVAGLVMGQTKPAPKGPGPADWAALGKLPDFTGVWEIPLGGGGGRGRGAPPAANRTGGGRGPAAVPALTPEYAAKAQELAKAATKAEDNLSANCLPPGMPGIMSQPYP